MIQDHFDERHKMIGQLMDMLRKSSSDEVSTGLKAPEGMGDGAEEGIQVERVEVLPTHKMDEPTPEHEVITKKLSEGGEITAEEGDGRPDAEGAVHEEVSESEAERQEEADIEPPAFSTFFGRKKKK